MTTGIVLFFTTMAAKWDSRSMCSSPAPWNLPWTPLITHDEDILMGQDVWTLAGGIRDEGDLGSRYGWGRLEDLFHIHHGCYFVATTPLDGFYFGMNNCNLKLKWLLLSKSLGEPDSVLGSNPEALLKRYSCNYGHVRAAPVQSESPHCYMQSILFCQHSLENSWITSQNERKGKSEGQH